MRTVVSMQHHSCFVQNAYRLRLQGLNTGSPSCRSLGTGSPNFLTGIHLKYSARRNTHILVCLSLRARFDSSQAVFPRLNHV